MKLSERDNLLVTLASNRAKLVKQRIVLARRARETAAAIEDIDKRLGDIEQSEYWLANERVAK